jgi:acyl-homoserine lactone acylase PvdQ
MYKISYDKKEQGHVQTRLITRTNDDTRHNSFIKEDLFYALGYIHAQDRLNLIEYHRAIANGTLSHFIPNPDSETLDRLSSIIGFTREADLLYEKLDSEVKIQLSKYTEGINQIRHTRHFVRIAKNEWTPTDVLAILIMKEWAEAYLANTELFTLLMNPEPKYLNYSIIKLFILQRL